MLYLTVGFIALAVYCVALTVVVRRKIKDIRRSFSSTIFDIKVKLKNHADNIDNLAYEIPNLQDGIKKSDELLSDILDRIDVTVDKLLDVRVENILRERDVLETKYRELLQKHNDLASAYDEYKKKHPDYITVTEIPVAKTDDRVTTCKLKVEDDDFVDISDGKDELDDIPIKIVAKGLKEEEYSNAEIAKETGIDESFVRPLVVEDDELVDISDRKEEAA